MYQLELERIGGKIVGRCEINHNLIVSRPKTTLDKVLDEILQVAQLLDEPVYEEPVFEVVWVENRGEVSDRAEKNSGSQCSCDHHQNCIEISASLSHLIPTEDN
ncbi:hypothetical protein [Telluribacter humicola]|uniref:hypothetical protein n=1 Tax=Telluribacter humicola TaxID=1720261 RepID=UPI001A97413D|nr:hypothetical protein [Telluribacter humicola]